VGERSEDAVTDSALIEARRLHGLGIAANNAGHPSRALRLLQRALRTLADSTATSSIDRAEVTARIWISIATSESELNGLERGLLALAEAERLATFTANTGLKVLLDNQIGFMQVRGGHVDQGLRHLDSAVTNIEQAEPSLAYSVLLNRGCTHLFLGNLTSARRDLSEATQLAAVHDLPSEEAKSRHNLGYLEFLAGNLALALRTMDEVLSLDADVSLAVILLDRSRVLLEAGLYREADDALDEAERLFRADRLWKDVGEVELARAECALLDGEIDAARRLAGSARTRFRRRGNDRWRRTAELVLLQADLEADRPGTRLAPAALRLAAEFREDGLKTQARTAQLFAAEALLRAGRTEQARAVAAEAGEIRELDPISSRLHTRLVRARLSLTTGDRTAGRREIRTGLKELANYQARFGSIDLQTASAIHGHRLGELNLQLALAEGTPSNVLAAVEQGRAISNRLPSVSAPADPVAAELLAELRQVVEGLRVIESDPTAAHQVSSQRHRVAEIQRALRSRSWQAEGAGRALKPAKFDEIDAALAEASSVLVCYLEVEGRLHAVMAGVGQSRIVTLGSTKDVSEQARRVRADLDVLANGYLPGALQTAVTGSLNRSLASLEATLVRPLGLPDSRIVIVPTGVLGALPWTNLPSLRGRPVVVAPSATAWLAASGPIDRTHIAVAAFAGPDLMRAADEVKAVGGCWPDAAVFTESGARHGQLASALTTASVVHVAAHGEHHADNPLFSSIRLADAPLFAYELDQTAKAAEHVVLSACELGQATIRPGDEALGLTSVLLHLGTRSVISGVARVHDEVAAEVMTRYHAALSSGVDSAQALADACATQGALPTPFVCFGATW
jgi:tetratricopeptide (TPR) repeat protein